MTANVPAATATKPHILCVGAAVLDTIFQVKELPSGQGKILPTNMIQIAEGMAASAAFAVAQLGGEVTLWSAVGNDAAGKQIVSELQDSGINTSEIIVVEGAKSALSTILVDEQGERLIVPYYDPALHKQPKGFSDTDLQSFNAVLVDVRWPELAYQVLDRARALGIPAILDGDVAPVELLRKLGSVASHIIFSEPAAKSLTQLSDGPAILKALAVEFPNTFLSVTFGEKGSYWLENREEAISYHPTMNVKAVDTLAAGDIFHGTFALGIAEKLPTIEIVQMASAAAAIKCTYFGGRLGAPSRSQLETAQQAWLSSLNQV